MSGEVNNTIQANVSSSSPHLEGKALETISPGMMVNKVVGGIEPFGTADVQTGNIVAIENVYHGGTINEDYITGDKVMMRVLRSGDEFLCIVNDGIVVTVGQALSNFGDGSLYIPAGAAHVVAFSTESVTASGPTFVPVRIA